MGRLTNNPEVRQLPHSNTWVAKFTIAVNKKYKTANNELKEDTSFFDVEAFGKVAERIGEYCIKGTKVLIEGSLKQDKWETETGEKRSRVKIVAGRSSIIAQPQTNPHPLKTEDVAVEDIDDEIPF